LTEVVLVLEPDAVARLLVEVAGNDEPQDLYPGSALVPGWRFPVAATRPPIRIPFDLALMHSIESAIVSFAFSSHRRRKIVEVITPQHAALRPSGLRYAMPSGTL